MAGYQIRSKFELGYRNKEDISQLPPEVLVIGSQNVLTNAAEQVGVRQGYVLDGDAGTQNTYGIDSAYDFAQSSGTKNVRKWGPNLQVRYTNPVTSALSWKTIFSILNPVKKVRFTDFWDYTNEKSLFCLFVNGGQTVFEWSGAVASFASASNASGIIGSITANPNVSASDSGGTGYVVGDILTIAAGNSDAQLTVQAVAPGGITTMSINNAGASGYSANDIIKITGAGTQAAFAKVITVDGGGHVTAISLLTAGVGYFPQVGITTTNTTNGAATGLTLDVTVIGNTITQWTLTTNGTGYSGANLVPTTGGSGTGATVQINSVAQYSITISGTSTVGQLGFYNTAANAPKFRLLINGTVYTYTASNANGGFTFIGINVDPTAQGFTVGDAIIQPPVSGASAGANASFLGAGFNIDLISTLNNQVWYGSLTNNSVYTSHTDDYTTVAFSSPRLPGEGMVATLDAPPVGFKPQSNSPVDATSSMYVAAGESQWYSISFALSADLTNESVSIERLKTTPLQGAQSQELIADFKNTIAFISHEPILNEFGITANYFAEPQMDNISDPIKYDMDAYDFSDGQVFYWNYYLFFTLPAEGILRMFNVQKKYWEAPQIIPISRFYLVEGQIYGHSSMTDESYQLFTGYNDNGNPINAVAAFPYVAMVPEVGEVDDLKAFDRIYTEGYIAGNTILTLTKNYDFGGFSGTYSVNISGQPAFGGKPNPIIFNKVTDGSLGQNSLGSQPIGSILNLGTAPVIPKFRVINTMPKHDYFESQTVYSSNDVDQQWTLLRFGELAQHSINLPSFITE